METAISPGREAPPPRRRADGGAEPGQAGGANPSVLLVGQLAAERAVVEAGVSCGQVDGLFREDRSLGSVVVDADDRPRLVNRSAFYQALTGRLGFGWALHHHRPIGDVPIVPGIAFPASETVEAAALALLTGDVVNGDDVLVLFPDGRVGTLAVTALVGELAALYARQTHRLSSNERWLRSLLQHSRDVVVVLDAQGCSTPAPPSSRSPDGIRRSGWDAAPSSTSIPTTALTPGRCWPVRWPTPMPRCALTSVSGWPTGRGGGSRAVAATCWAIRSSAASCSTTAM